jgi:hypothetical protein
MAEVMGGEACLMRAQFVSGTHAIATALFSVLRPGDELLAVAGKPYDTMEEVIGLRGMPGTQWSTLYDHSNRTGGHEHLQAPLHRPCSLRKSRSPLRVQNAVAFINQIVIHM